MNIEFKQLHKISDAKLIDPATIKCKVDGTNKYLSLCGEAVRILYYKLGLSFSVSKKVYQISQDIWQDIINLRISQTEDFDLDNMNYVVHETSSTILVVSIVNKPIDSLLDEFYNECNSLKYEEIVNTSGILQLKIYQELDNNTKALVLLDIDYMNGLYRVYDGIEANNRILLSGLPTIEEGNIEILLTTLNIKDELGMSIKLSKNLIKEYNPEIAASMVLSLREVLDIIKIAKLDISLDDNGMVYGIVGIDKTDELKEFLNSFDMPYKSLRKLTYLRKSLKYKDLTIDGMLNILTSEYMSPYNSVNAYLISYLMRIYYSQDSDRNIAETELK